jgi:hypothetical protein
MNNEVSPDYWCGVEDGGTNEREQIYADIKTYLKDKPLAIIGHDSGSWIVEGLKRKRIEGDTNGSKTIRAND